MNSSGNTTQQAVLTAFPIRIERIGCWWLPKVAAQSFPKCQHCANHGKEEQIHIVSYMVKVGVSKTIDMAVEFSPDIE